MLTSKSLSLKIIFWKELLISPNSISDTCFLLDIYPLTRRLHRACSAERSRKRLIFNVPRGMGEGKRGRGGFEMEMEEKRKYERGVERDRMEREKVEQGEGGEGRGKEGEGGIGRNRGGEWWRER